MPAKAGTHATFGWLDSLGVPGARSGIHADAGVGPALRRADGGGDERGIRVCESSGGERGAKWLPLTPTLAPLHCARGERGKWRRDRREASATGPLSPSLFREGERVRERGRFRVSGIRLLPSASDQMVRCIDGLRVHSTTSREADTLRPNGSTHRAATGSSRARGVGCRASGCPSPRPSPLCATLEGRGRRGRRARFERCTTGPLSPSLFREGRGG